MKKQAIKALIERSVTENGLVETGVKGVQLFRHSDPLRCSPAVYEPCVIAIINGAKEAILDGQSYIYDSSRYMCCTMSMPVEAGVRNASLENPLLGVYIALDIRLMTELAIEMESITGTIRQSNARQFPPSFSLARWDKDFIDALLNLLQLCESPTDTAVLGAGRLRELYYAILKGEAGSSARRAFGVGNEIARAIEYLSTRLDKTVTIDEIASHVGMSRASFHRKFKQSTTQSPIQFIKSMRLNKAAMKIAEGMNVNQAAMAVGYVSSSQFNREFKRLYGQPPKQWILKAN